VPHSFPRKLLLPFLDALHGLDRCLDRGWTGLALAGCGLLAGWWVYVPLHELLHAAACRLAGGEVTRLEIDAAYGGALLARVFPFVVPASDYAGRLSGFDTGGSDLVYLATDLGPFLLTLFPGVWGLRRAAAARNGLLFGALLPFALAPFLSLTGDAYEIGSILVTNLPPWEDPAAREALRGDDLFARAGEISGRADAPWGGFLLAAFLGVLWAFLTYGLGAAAARLDRRLPRS
jgi:amino acid transporter